MPALTRKHENTLVLFSINNQAPEMNLFIILFLYTYVNRQRDPI